jgi:hypothetical protein
VTVTGNAKAAIEGSYVTGDNRRSAAIVTVIGHRMAGATL